MGSDLKKKKKLIFENFKLVPTCTIQGQVRAALLCIVCPLIPRGGGGRQPAKWSSQPQSSSYDRTCPPDFFLWIMGKKNFKISFTYWLRNAVAILNFYGQNKKNQHSPVHKTPA